jgi:hypothetical protein
MAYRIWAAPVLVQKAAAGCEVKQREANQQGANAPQEDSSQP